MSDINPYYYSWREISIEQWCDILQNHEITTQECIDILKVVDSAKDHRLNASKIAEILNISHFIVLNRIVGSWGKKIAQAYPEFTFPKREKTGRLRCWLVVFDGEDCWNPTHFDWILKPEMLAAIKKLHLFDEKIQTRMNSEVKRILKSPPPTGEEKLYLAKHRANQGRIRDYALEHYGCKCHLCSLKIRSLLVVSHILPWSESDNKQKADMNNLLLLCPQHDALFDQHLISFDCDGKILIDSSLDETVRVLLNINPDMKIEIPPAMEEYMKHHRNKFLFNSEMSSES